MEGEIEKLPPGGNPNSFRILAEWLRDNRRMLEGRLDKQDAKMEEIHREVKKTNGRVTDLEKSVEITAALADGHEVWEHELQAVSNHRKRLRMEWRIAAMLGGCTLLGGAVGELGHHIGFW